MCSKFLCKCQVGRKAACAVRLCKERAYFSGSLLIWSLKRLDFFFREIVVGDFTGRDQTGKFIAYALGYLLVFQELLYLWAMCLEVPKIKKGRVLPMIISSLRLYTVLQDPEEVQFASSARPKYLRVLEDER